MRFADADQLVYLGHMQLVQLVFFFFYSFNLSSMALLARIGVTKTYVFLYPVLLL